MNPEPRAGEAELEGQQSSLDLKNEPVENLMEEESWKFRLILPSELIDEGMCEAKR